MSEINQSIGLDASKAIKSLSQLQFSIDTVNQRMMELNVTSKKDPFASVPQSTRRATKAMQDAERRVMSLRQEFTKLGAAGANSSTEITLSWQTMARVVQTQFIVRGLNILQRQFFETAEAAREFEEGIARIATITSSSEAGGTFDELAISVRDLAIELGRPIAAVQEAAYESLQNDIGNTRESLEFLTTANKLALVTNSDLTQSVNSITSVLKAYNLSISEAERVANGFFRTIDVGRVSLDELENRLGTILPQAAILGVEFEQVGASVSTLTLAGLNTAKATTQLRNVFAKLIKPTKELDQAFTNLGVRSGQELIASFGGDLPSALQALTKEFNNNEAALANAFGTIRGQLGVLTLLSGEAQEFNRVVSEFEDTGGILEEAYGKVAQTNARAYEVELAKINDTLLGLGNTSSRIQTSALSLFNVLIPNASAAQGVIAGLGVASSVAFLRYVQGAIAATTATRTLSASVALLLGPWTLLAAALAGVTAVFISSYETMDDRARNSIALQNRLAAEQQAFVQRLEKERVETVEESFKEIDRVASDFFRNIQKLYQEDSTAFIREQDRIRISVDRLFDDFGDSRKSILEEIDSFIASIDGRIEDSTDRIRRTTQDLEDFNFDRAQQGLDEASQAINEYNRALNTARDAQRALNAATTDEQRERALGLLDLAEDRARDALNSADRVNDVRLIRQAEEQVRNIIVSRLNAEEKLRNDLQSINETQLGVERDRVALLLQQQDILSNRARNLRSVVDESGQQLSAREIQQNFSEARKLEEQIAQIDEQLKNLGVVEDLGLADEIDDFAKRFSEGLNRVSWDFASASIAFQRSITEGGPYEAIVEITQQAGRSANQQLQQELDAISGGRPQDVLARQLEARREALDELLARRNQVEALNKAIASAETATLDSARSGALPTGLQGIGFQLQRLASIPGVIDARNPLVEEQQFGQSIIDLFNQIKTEGEETIPEVQRRLIALRDSLNEKDFGENRINAFREALESAQEAIDGLRERSLISAPQQEEIDQLNVEIIDLSEKIRQFNKSEIPEANTQVSNLRTTANNVNFRNATTSAQALINKLQTAAQLAAQVGSAGNINAYFGKPIYKNNGGSLSRGQDTQLVSTSPGEFITNARSSSRFFAQLRAINAGQSPIFREQGGPVTNVGDINVNVDARNSASVDGRQIAKSINREIRRGSSRLRG